MTVPHSRRSDLRRRLRTFTVAVGSKIKADTRLLAIALHPQHKSHSSETPSVESGQSSDPDVESPTMLAAAVEATTTSTESPITTANADPTCSPVTTTTSTVISAPTPWVPEIPPPPPTPSGNDILLAARQNLRKVDQYIPPDARNLSIRESVILDQSAAPKITPTGPSETGPEDTRVLFDFVVLVTLGQQDGGPLSANVTYSFPPSIIQKPENQKLLASIPQFCFPDVDQFTFPAIDEPEPVTEKSDSELSKKTVTTKTYSFVITNVDGTRRFAYCRRLHTPSQKNSKQMTCDCYCILSSYPCFSLFSQLLDVVESKKREGNVVVYSFLKHVLSLPFPERGKMLRVTAQNLSTGKLDSIGLYRPYETDPLLEYVNFSQIFQILSVKNILILFSSLLFERRVIVVSKDISVVTGCLQALVAMLYPFEWQHVLIPVLPKKLLDYCCSPIPFLVGVLSIHVPLVEKLPKEEVVIAFVDEDRVQTIPGIDDVASLPPNHVSVLRTTFKKLTSSSDAARPNNKTVHLGIAKAFLSFFVEIFHDFEDFVETKEGTEKRFFNTEAFIKSRTKADRKFMELFFASQMFERWRFDVAEKVQLKAGGTSFAGEQQRFQIEVDKFKQKTALKR